MTVLKSLAHAHTVRLVKIIPNGKVIFRKLYTTLRINGRDGATRKAQLYTEDDLPVALGPNG